MIEVKPMTSDDEIREVKALYLSHEKTQRSVTLKAERDIDVLIENGFRIVGALDTDVGLVSFATQLLFKSQPIHRIGNIYIRKNTFNSYFFGVADHPIPKIIDEMLLTAESLGYYTWLYSRADLPIYEKLQARKQDMLRWCRFGYDNDEYRYERFLIEKIPPLSRSKFELHNKLFLLGKNSVPINIFQCCLKEKFK